MGAARRRYQQPAPSRGVPKPEPRLSVVKPVEDPAVESRLSRQTVEACIRLREIRGERFRKPKTKDQPHRVLDELDTMLERGEITRSQFEAGRRYGELLRAAKFYGGYTSSLNVVTASRAPHEYQRIMEQRVKDFQRIQRIRDRAFSGADRFLVRLCDDICGSDYLIDGGRDARARAAELVSWLLTRLAYAYGILR